MSDETKNLYRNPDPPSEDFDFEIIKVTKKIIYYTNFGTECQYMNNIDPELLGSQSESEEYFLTSSEDDDCIILEIPPQKNKKASPIKRQTIKEEILSDDEDFQPPKREKRPKCRTKNINISSDSEDDFDFKHKPRKDIPIKIEEPIERKPLSGISAAFGKFICQLCNIEMTSEATLNTHLLGKRHEKAKNALAVPEVAMQSLSLMSNSERDFGDGLRVPLPPLGAKRVKIHERSYIQRNAEDYRRAPIPGLSMVVEIRCIDGKEVKYYCKLCDAPCSPASILTHLVGFKHQLRCFETIEPSLYDRYKFFPKRDIERIVFKSMTDYERRHGRGIIEVFLEVEDKTRVPPSDPWIPRDNSGSNDDNPIPEDALLSAMEDLDTSQNDFRCTVCDSHMNNKNMWEAHIRGKRHLKNKKKYPGESASKVRAIFCPDEISSLDQMLKDYPEVYVGLEYIRETQGDAGNMYNCFLCGACCTEFDIIDHLLLTKHRVKYLETMNKKGHSNGIEEIKMLHDVSTYYKDSLILGECRELLDSLGVGKIEVYKSKKNFSL